MELRKSTESETKHVEAGSDVLKRAEMFSLIERLVHAQHSSVTNTAFSLDHTFLQGGAFGRESLVATLDPLPQVTIWGTTVVYGEGRLDLSGSLTMLKLFKIFVAAPHGELTRDELLLQLYGIDARQGHSQRYLESQFNNAVKMISRARLAAIQAFGSFDGYGIEWFAYDLEGKSWNLFRLYRTR